MQTLEEEVTQLTHEHCSALHPQVMITNWVTTYGEVIVRIPPRAFGWKEAGAVGGNITYVVRSASLGAASHLCVCGCQLTAWRARIATSLPLSLQAAPGAEASWQPPVRTRQEHGSVYGISCS